MASTRVTASVTDLTRAGGTVDRFFDRLHLWLVRQLAFGRPVTRGQIEQAAARLTGDPGRAVALLDAHTEHNDAGEITGLGLTLNATAHRVTIDGTRMWAWCAMDCLELAVLLDKQITVYSQPPGPGGAVRLHASPDGVSGVSPAESVITMPVRFSDQLDLDSPEAIWASLCHYSLFFPSRSHAGQWAAGRDDIEILSLAEGFAAARELAAAMLRHEHQGTSAPQATGWRPPGP
jgi:alkylmercury lyase